MKQEILDYIEAHRQYGYDLLAELGRIPAPSNHEEKRAQFVCEWFHKNGAPQAFIDEALNVVCPIGVTETNPVTVFMAHMDVVFPDTTPLPLKVQDGKMCCPGIGDDTANLVALLLAAKYVLEQQLQPVDGKGFVFVANAGEEGLGNLKGSRRICESYAGRIAEFCSFDGYFAGLTRDAVGSERYRVEVRTEGGHSFGCFGNRNAIAYLSSMIDTLYEMKPPVTKTRTTYNVGTIRGGTSVNTIAQQAEMLYEYRSDSAADLAFMRRHFEAVIEAYRAKGITVQVELLGQRPCSGEVDPEKLDALSQRIGAAIAAYSGVTPAVHAGSTDCNIPLSLGIPAVCVGVVDGAGAHTREEYVCIDSFVKGYRCAFACILPYFGVEG
mgnify:FL=1